MESFNKPENLNGATLVEELEAAGIKVKPNGLGTKSPVDDGAGLLWLDIASKDKASASAVVANHQG